MQTCDLFNKFADKSRFCSHYLLNTTNRDLQ